MAEGLRAVAAAKKHLRQKIADRLKYVSQESVLDQSNAIADTVRALPEYKGAKTIGVYMHMEISHVLPRKSGRNVEVRTDTLIKNAFDDGKQVYLPRIIHSSDLSDDLQNLFRTAQHRLRSDVESNYFPSRFLKMLKMPDYEAVQALVVQNEGTHAFTIKEPSHGDDALETAGLDLIIVPGLVFTTACERIGRGKGFYDNYVTLHKLASQGQGRRGPWLVGIGLREQLVRENDVVDTTVNSFPCEDHDQQLDILVVESDIYRRPCR
ncbi:hypothetical protein POJ06DRAFT_67316 [Lipomyces tetrasporus]|uniref:5-formyltetrahydrofolate cyclo-ligase n=1 Tax=Lipomyces tetrasporus TaxID=54092 RepID=A0AAD7QXW7_9ASCO|nr:uncharacterized protein POJ06DRAFT_67316 [Lipomyces tetrasporus]KAJ8103336.1 hypothetical protein POJ06DRAFT_67316 [Lipomyces tetrasporus]